VDDGGQVAKGGYGIVRLIVPSESHKASTVGVTVTLPDTVDLASARTLPVPGWTATVETEQSGQGQRVSRITWRADDNADGLKATEYGEFAFSAGPWPIDADSVALSADQAYSDGSVVSWNEIAVDKDSEPEHPAPVLTLAEPDPAHSHAGDGHGAAPPASATPETVLASAEATGGEWFWRATSAVSLLIAIGTAAALGVVLRRSRS
jgi:uncharacterized protein YcnI